MLLKFRCNARFPIAGTTKVLGHFDGQPGTRSIEIQLPAPGPTVGDLYEIDINGNGIPPSGAPTLNLAIPAEQQVQELVNRLNGAIAERDETRSALDDAVIQLSAARAELEQLRALSTATQEQTPS